MSLIINGIDVTDDVLEGTLRIQERCDSGMAQGSCQLYTNLIAKNIPPYSICTIDGTKYFISSEASQDLQNSGYWTHDCIILELTAILQCYILGTKCFSAVANHNDKTKIDYIADVITTKYGKLNFTISMTLADNHEFLFGPGTTMYQALTEILSWYNYRPKVTAYSITSGTTSITISTTALNSNATYSLSDLLLISKTYRQNVDDYGAILESEMKNVVDRTDTIVFKDLTCRSEDILFNLDQAIIKLPCKVEKINKLTTRASTNKTIVVISNDSLNENTDLTWLDSGAVGFKYIIHTFDDWTREAFNYYRPEDPNQTDVGELVGSNIAAFLWSNYYSNEFSWDEFKTQKWILYKATTSRVDNSNQTVTETVYRFKPFNGNEATQADIYNAIQSGNAISNTESDIYAHTQFDLRLVEKSVWDTMTNADQSTYAVYESGGDKIYNLDGEYKYNFWSQITGFTGHSFLYGYSAGTTTEIYNDPSLYLTLSLTHVKGALSNTDATQLLFDVECVPISNPIIIDTDTSAKPNETSQKLLSKSYQNSSSTVSFDNVIDGIKKTNTMLGQPEVEIEYDTTDVTLPVPTNKIEVDGTYYYVMAVTTEYHRNYRKSYINLSSSYSKIADAIGVESQYHSTRLPVDTIVERPICIDSSVSIAESDIAGKNVFAYFWFANDRKFLIRPSIMKQGNKIYFYCEFEDNYSAGKTLKSTYAANSNMEMLDTPYGDSNNEIGNCYITLYDLGALSREQSYTLPVYDSSVFPNMVSVKAIEKNGNTSFLIRKDTREKLTFTIICNYTG